MEKFKRVKSEAEYSQWKSEVSLSLRSLCLSFEAGGVCEGEGAESGAKRRGSFLRSIISIDVFHLTMSLYAILSFPPLILVSFYFILFSFSLSFSLSLLLSVYISFSRDVCLPFSFLLLARKVSFIVRSIVDCPQPSLDER